jgi:release factor glutamine methyltransferase
MDLDPKVELRGVERLADEVGGAELQAAEGCHDLIVGVERHDLQRPSARLLVMTLPDYEMKRLRTVAQTDAELSALVAMRLAGEPLQYLEGTAAFGPLDLYVDERVLIPRPETEQLWELAVSLVESPRVIVDLCSGSGALAIALSRSFPQAQVFGTDVSDEAIEVAIINGARLEARVEWCSGDLFAALPDALRGAVDLMVSNPPYVTEAEYADLPEDVQREPRTALVSGPTGLEMYERISTELPAWLAPGGRFALEIGETQADSVMALFADWSPEVRRDLAGRDRYVIGANP